jgi:hypothetical protein
MIAHLQDGRYSDASIGEARILKAATAQQMRSTLYTPHPRLLGVAYGSFDFSDNGQRTLGHAGEFPPTMHSLLLLLPDQRLGVFVTYNSQGAGGLTIQHQGFQRAFFDHYYPAPAAAPIQPVADFTQRAGRFEGSYRWTTASETTLMKVLGLFGTVEISHPGDGTLLLATGYGDWRFVEVEPLYFRQVDGPFRLAFQEDEQGRITYMFADLMPQFAFEKLGWFESPRFQLPLLGGCILLFLSMLPAAATRLIRDGRQSGGRKPAPRGTRAAYWIMLGICGLNPLFLTGVALWGLPPSILFSLPVLAKVALGLGVLAAGLTVGALVYTVWAWKNGHWSVAARVYYTLVTVAALAFVWLMNYWNLLGWRY